MIGKMFEQNLPHIMNRIRKAKDLATRTELFVQGWGQQFTNDSSHVQNIYHACVQKTGSQWIKAVFMDPDMRRVTGLRVHPQFRYEAGEFKRKFPRYTFIPGLYISYPLYNEIRKPERYKTIYVIRDPRDIVVSWYYSAKFTHPLVGNVPKYRRELLQLDESDGITYCIQQLQLKFSFMRTWWNNRSDPYIYISRFEDITADPVSEWSRIFDHCEIEIDSRTLETVFNRYSKEKMREQDLKNRDGNRSHYRKEKSGWRELFNAHHVELFSKVNGDLVEQLGYELS